MKKMNRKDRLLGFAFLAPALLLILFSTGIPIVTAARTSLYATNYAKLGNFVGFEHYKSILFSSEGWYRIFNSVVYVLLSLLLVIPAGVGGAVLLNRKIRGRSLWRTLIVIPWILSQTVSALLWKWLLNANFGPVVYVIMALTGQQIDFLNSPLTARFMVTVANAWNTIPIVLILNLAALQTIPEELYEAAKVDGSKGIHSLVRITLPLILPTIMTTIIMQSMEYFNMVTLIYVMTSGGPFSATETMSVKAFKEGFDYWHMGLGSAYSIIIFALNMVFSTFYIRLLKGKSDGQ
jgi:ABC-type sugar transport system permease subunit